MKITSGAARAEVTRSAEIADGPVLTERYGWQRNFTAERLQVVYRFEDGRFSTAYVSVWGRMVKKDGTPGVREGELHWFRPADAPAWVQAVTDQLRPDTNMSMTAIRDWEVEA